MAQLLYRSIYFTFYLDCNQR